MRFLLDESADARLAAYLRQHGHDVTTIAIDYPASLTDQQELGIAARERRILITNDRDFGELIVAQHQPHAGVILFRLGPYAELAAKIERLAHVLAHRAMQMDQFLVVTRDRGRVRQPAQRPEH